MKTKKNLTAEELEKLRNIDFSKEKHFVNGSKLLAEEFGEKGSPEREVFDAKAKAWYYGEILRDRRKALGITQKELAEKIGRERTYINRIEKGDTDMQLSSFLRITDALGISLRLDINIG